MQVTINKLAVKNFKGFYGEREFEFSPITKIEADNYQGKTSIAEAIVFGLCGTNLYGTNRGLDTLVSTGQKSTQVMVGFTVNGEEYELLRKKAKTGSLVLNGRKATQADIEKLIGPTDKFIAAFWPAALGAMKNTEAREFFMGLVRPPVYAEVMDKVDATFKPYLELHKSSLLDPAGLAKEIRQEIKQAESDIERCTGHIEALQETLIQEVPELKDTSQLSEAIEKLNVQIQLLKSEPDLIDVSDLEEKLESLRSKARTLKEEGGKLEYGFEAGEVCPTCGQEISEGFLDRVRHELDAKRQDLLAQYQQVVAEGQTVKATLENIRAENERTANEFNATFTDQTKELYSEREELQKQLNQAMVDNSLRDKLLQQIRDASDKIAEQQDRIKNNEESIQYNTIVLQAIKEYTTTQVDMITDQVQRHLKRASLQLFDVVKSTGELKPVFKLLYDSKPYEVLSTSERIRLGLEIAGFVKQAIGIEYPTFVDNSESITHYDAPPGQVFDARVVEGAELAIRK